MARPMKPLVRGGGFYPSRKWTPLVYAGGYTTANGGEEPAPPPIEKTITGNPIHILDALAKPAQALSVKLEPIQDLHGYDNPWPAGGGKNLVDPNTTIFNRYLRDTGGGSYYWTYSSDSKSIAIKVDPETTYTLSRYLTTGAIYRVSTIRVASLPSLDDTTDIETYQNVRETSPSAFGTTRTITTDTSATFVVFQFNAATTQDFVEHGQLEKGSTASSYAPYSNICPISGWTGAKVTRTGINVWDEEWELGLLNSDGSVSGGARVTSKNYIPVVPNKTYCFSLPDGFYAAGRGAYYDADKNLVQYLGDFPTNISHGGDRQFALFTVPGNASYLKFCVNGQYGTTYNNDISINYPATDTSYHAYQGETYSITFPSSVGTVYGGTLDVTQGKLTVDRAMVDLGTLTWFVTSATFKRFRAVVSGIERVTAGSIAADMICSSYATKNANQTYIGQDGVSLQQNADDVYIYDSKKTDLTADEFKTAMSGVQLCYELATPIVYDLTPTEITLLLGTNNIWSDGEMTLVYLADGNASDEEALNILLGGRYVNNHGEDEPTDREALNIILGGNEK